MNRLGILFAALLLVACDGQSLPADDGGLVDAGAADGGPAPVCPVQDPPAPNPSTASVVFELTGPAGTYIADMGDNCQHLMISGVQLARPTELHCEGPPPPGPSVSHAVPAQDGVSFGWAGTSLVGYISSCVDCAMRGWTGLGLSPERTWVGQGMPAGTYSAVFVVLDEVSSGCTENMDGALDCYNTIGGVGGDGTSLCPGGRNVTVEFELPASGELVVPVDVTPPAP